MESVLQDIILRNPIATATIVVAAGIFTVFVRNIYFHSLTRYPGPRLAAATTYWHAFVECVLHRSFLHVLEQKHARYGDVVRIGPNELHFSDPIAYFAIYRNKWDKEENLYHSFGEDRSSFGFLHYRDAKERKDVLNKTFSEKATNDAQGLVQQKVDALVDRFMEAAQGGTPVHLLKAYRCFTMDVVTALCFGKSVEALKSPEFQSPILASMDASMAIFPRFKHANWYKSMIMGCPPAITRVLSPPMAGLLDLQKSIRDQIDDLSNNPDHLELLPHKQTIFHQLMSPEASKTGTAISRGSCFEEAQALLFGGADTVGNALTVTTFNLLKRPEHYRRLKKEINEAWPVLDEQPSLRELGQLPYLDAVIHEGLRMSSGVVGGLLRVVPAQGALICGNQVPGGTIVSCGSTFVHYNADIFPEPERFEPDRWLKDTELKHYLVSFSRGPRACVGQNLAWQELRVVLASVLRRFDMTLEASSPQKMTFSEAFLPHWTSSPVKVTMKSVGR